MIPLVWIRVIVIGVVTTIISSLLYLGYTSIKDIGYREAAAKYEIIIKENETKIANKIDNIERLSNTLAIQNRETSEALAGDISLVLKGIKTKPLTIIKNGDCIPNTTFTDTFNTINSRTNQALRESQK